MFQEFSTLSDDANIYKLVGPVLLKQETSEAKSTVDGRLEYIEKEMYVYFPNFPCSVPCGRHVLMSSLVRGLRAVSRRFRRRARGRRWK
jgi:hypothetical protein